MSRLALLAACLLPLSLAADGKPPAPLRAMQEQAASVAATATKAVVKVRGAGSYGSGVVISPDGLVVTNARLVTASAGDPARVVLPDGSTVKAALLGSDRENDIALLRAEGKDLPWIPLAGAEPAVGDMAILIGKAFYRSEGKVAVKLPLVDSDSVEVGIVNGKGPLSDPDRRFPFRGTALFIDTPINPGCEGGALLNAAGELAGVVGQLQNDARTWDEMDFAVPVGAIRSLVASANVQLPSAEPREVPWREMSEAYRKAAEAAVPSIAQIHLLRKKSIIGIPDKNGPGPYTGVILDAEGHILSGALHFPRGRDEAFEVRTADGAVHPAKLLAFDHRRDLALLKADNGPFTPAVFADPKSVRPGRLAVAVSASFGFPENPAFHTGIVSAVDREQGAVQTDAHLLYANRGGPLVDLDGKVLGVLTQLYRQGDRDSEQKNGVAFAVPWKAIEPALAILKRGEDVHPPYAGVGFASGMNEAGCMIKSVTKGSPAEKAGLKPADMILAVDGRPALNPIQFKKLVQERLPGDKAVFKVEKIRKGKITVEEIEVVLEKRGK